MTDATLTFRCVGYGAFPLDQLRRFTCWPLTTDDANAIELSIRAPERDLPYCVTVTGVPYGSLFTFMDRMNSFGWRSEDITPYDDAA